MSRDLKEVKEGVMLNTGGKHSGRKNSKCKRNKCLLCTRMSVWLEKSG